jgi:NAD(P)-dependent dehydrogenase (short-subunit alcohol dehydrogenase family)
VSWIYFSLPALLHSLHLILSSIFCRINNAGATWGASFDEYPDEAWEKVMNLNVRSVFNLTQKLAPKLEAAGQLGDPARVIVRALCRFVVCRV